ncbi:hypothetical protein CBR_g52454 [Chara braunii]|uniref:Uncharacterized protein n=1 Tax=Chara braunii TaxID=69332 RepID=A0A388MAA1_CHABU|nr:hypothetical protein CBR_g52454 [Chara braunii]|eukprot:GBG91498.1 hypothetical protein CBR_g52454 [Chara braunii]
MEMETMSDGGLWETPPTLQPMQADSALFIVTLYKQQLVEMHALLSQEYGNLPDDILLEGEGTYDGWEEELHEQISLRQVDANDRAQAVIALYECAGMLTQVKDMFTGFLARRDVGGPPGELLSSEGQDSVTWTASTTSATLTTSTTSTTATRETLTITTPTIVTSPIIPLCVQKQRPSAQACDELGDDHMVNGVLTDMGAAIRALAAEVLLTCVSQSYEQPAEDQRHCHHGVIMAVWRR